MATPVITLLASVGVAVLAIGLIVIVAVGWGELFSGSGVRYYSTIRR